MKTDTPLPPVVGPQSAIDILGSIVRNTPCPPSTPIPVILTRPDEPCAKEKEVVDKIAPTIKNLAILNI